VRCADAAVVNLLLACAPDLIDCMTAGGNSLLHLTAWHSIPEKSAAIARLVLSNCQSLADCRNHSDETVLCAAARAANVPLVRLMLEVRPSLITQRDFLGDTILHARLDRTSAEVTSV